MRVILASLIATVGIVIASPASAQSVYYGAPSVVQIDDDAPPQYRDYDRPQYRDERQRYQRYEHEPPRRSQEYYPQRHSQEYQAPRRNYEYDRPAYRTYGYGERSYDRGCRTIIIRHDNGMVRRIRRCD